MMQLKIIRGKPNVIERNVNDFLLQLAYSDSPTRKVEIKNTQLIHVGGPDAEEAFTILYNVTDIAKQPQPTDPANKPLTKPGPKGIGEVKDKPHSTVITKP